MKKLILIRGLPGSGKSTKAKELKEELEIQGVYVSHYEADMYFVDKDNKYVFEGSKIPQSHAWCLRMTASSFKNDRCVTIVSNTFTTKKEVQPYLDIAKDANAEVEVIEMHNNFGSIHNVPDEVIERMRARWETW